MVIKLFLEQLDNTLFCESLLSYENKISLLIQKFNVTEQ